MWNWVGKQLFGQLQAMFEPKVLNEYMGAIAIANNATSHHAKIMSGIKEFTLKLNGAGFFLNMAGDFASVQPTTLNVQLLAMECQINHVSFATFKLMHVHLTPHTYALQLSIVPHENAVEWNVIFIFCSRIIRPSITLDSHPSMCN